MAWIGSTYLNNAIGSGLVSALGITGSVLTQYELDARAHVTSIIQYAGYTAPGPTMDSSASVANAFLQSLACGYMLKKAYGVRKGIRMSPDIADTINDTSARLNEIYNKRLPVPGLTASSRAGYGGLQVSPTTGDSARPQVFSRSSMKGF